MTQVAAAESAADLQDWAAAAVERGSAAWPGVEVSSDELARIAALRIADPSARPIRVADLDAVELYAAAACSCGVPTALVQFRARYFDVLAVALHRIGVSAEQVDELWQLLCSQLFVGGPGTAPRVVRYAGSGHLAGLVRVAATRQAIKLRLRDRRDERDDSWFDALPATASDPELGFMKREHRDAVKQEIAAAVQRLSARQRMLLRLHLVQRLGIDAIAAICSVHRATAARQVAHARQALVTGVRLGLIARWRVSERELPALISLVATQLDLSLPRLLAA
jgi:RNA polymerase sigma-70 factor (ECF subfamily)